VLLRTLSGLTEPDFWPYRNKTTNRVPTRLKNGRWQTARASVQAETLERKENRIYERKKITERKPKIRTRLRSTEKITYWFQDFIIINYWSHRSQWMRGLRHELSLLSRTLGSWVRITLKAWMSVCVYSMFVLSCIRSGLTTGWSPVKGILPTVLGWRNWSETKRFTDAPKWEQQERERERGLLMWILFLGGYAVWMWIMLPTFRRYTLPPYSVINLSFVTSVTPPAPTECTHQRTELTSKDN
jgi:hypothetical protein